MQIMAKINSTPAQCQYAVPIELIFVHELLGTEVPGFWEHGVVFRMLYQYSEYLTYRTSLFYQG